MNFELWKSQEIANEIFSVYAEFKQKPNQYIFNKYTHLTHLWQYAERHHADRVVIRGKEMSLIEVLSCYITRLIKPSYSIDMYLYQQSHELASKFLWFETQDMWMKYVFNLFHDELVLVMKYNTGIVIRDSYSNAYYDDIEETLGLQVSSLSIEWNVDDFIPLQFTIQYNIGSPYEGEPIKETYSRSRSLSPSADATYADTIKCTRIARCREYNKEIKGRDMSDPWIPKFKPFEGDPIVFPW